MQLERFRILFGRRLRLLRQLESLTQAELAERAGISLEHVNKLERGAAAPSMASIIGLARALETEPANLFLFSDSPMAEAAVEDAQNGVPAVEWAKYVTRMGSWRRSLTTGAMVWSDSMYRIMGFEPGEVEPTREVFYETVHPDDLERVAASLRDVDKGRGLEKFEFRMRHRSGGWRHLMAHIEVRPNERGDEILVQGTIMDITEQRRLQQALMDTHTSLERRVQERTRHLQDVIMRLGEEIGQRKRAQEALRISDQIVSSSADAMCMIDSKYVYRAVNDAYTLRTGLRREDILGRHVSAVLGPGIFKSRIKPRLDGTLAGIGCHNTDWYELPGQGMRCLDSSYFPCRNDAGDIVGVVVNARDITEREHAQQALRDSEKLHRTVYERANMGIMRLSPEGRILEANHKACRMLGYTERELCALTFQDLTHPDDLEDNLRHHGLMLAGESDSMLAEKRYLRKDGSIIWCALAASAVRSRDGDISFFISAIKDITERKRAQEDLLVYQQIVSSSSDVMAMLDRDHRYRAVNKNYNLWFGMSDAELTGRTPSHVLGDDVYAFMVKPRLDACLAGKEIRVSEWWTLPRKGRRHLDITYTPCRDGEGRIIGTLIICRDDTDTHNSLVNLLESERNYRFLFDNMRDAIYLAELRPDGGLGLFRDVNRVACRTTGFTREELLRLSPIDLDAPEATEAVMEDVLTRLWEHGHALFETEQIAKDGRRIPVENHAVLFRRDGKDMVLAVARDLTQRKQAERALRESEARFRQIFDAAGDAICVHDLDGRILDVNRACHERLGYTLREMLAMRIQDIDAPETAALVPERVGKVLRDGGGTFEVVHMHRDGSRRRAEASTRVISHRGKPAIITVARDISHSLQMAENLMEGVDAKKDPSAVGFLAAMGHDIRTSLNSLLGMLDLARMARDTAERDECLATAQTSARTLLRAVGCLPDPPRPGDDMVQEAAPPARPGSGAHLRILVAEDDPVNRTTACRLLERLGHEAEGVEDGSVVLDMLRAGPYDLVLMDVEMPGMDGLEATRRIRASRSGRLPRHVPVVAMTAHALKGDRERFLAAGMDDYIAKPVGMDGLAALLHKVARSMEESGPDRPDHGPGPSPGV